jgi:hypothetical protein
MLARIRDVVSEEAFKKILLTDRALGGDVDACIKWLALDDARRAEELVKSRGS